MVLFVVIIGFCVLALLAAGLMYVLPHLARRRAVAALRVRCRGTGTLVLTYDDGPGAVLTPRLLRILRRHGVRATFFATGMRAVRHPRVLDALRHEGHEIGCHTDQHLHAWRILPWREARDVSDGFRVLERWIDPRRPIFRAPYGKQTLIGQWLARRHGAAAGWWTHVAGDTHPILPATSSVVADVDASGGGVVLMHDFDRGLDVERYVCRLTEDLIALARRRGWRICTMSELLDGPAMTAVTTARAA